MVGRALKHLPRSTTLELQQGTYCLNPQTRGSSQPTAEAVAARGQACGASPRWKARSRQAPLRRSWKRLQERHMSGAAGQLAPLRCAGARQPGLGAQRAGVCPWCGCNALYLPGFAAPQRAVGEVCLWRELMFEQKPVSPSLVEQDRPGAHGVRWSQPPFLLPPGNQTGGIFHIWQQRCIFFFFLLFDFIYFFFKAEQLLSDLNPRGAGSVLPPVASRDVPRA